jgi:hypothetical protein
MKTTQASQHSVTVDEPSIRSADDVVKALEADVEKGPRLRRHRAGWQQSARTSFVQNRCFPPGAEFSRAFRTR